MNTKHEFHITLMAHDGSDGATDSPWQECDRTKHDAMWDAGKTEGHCWSVYRRIRDGLELSDDFDLVDASATLTDALIFARDAGADDAYVGPGINEKGGWLVSTLNKHRRATFLEYTPDQLLSMPLRSNEVGVIIDRNGDCIADVWHRTLNGAPADEEDDAEAEELANLRAAEIVRRLNLHDELVQALRALTVGHALRSVSRAIAVLAKVEAS